MGALLAIFAVLPEIAVGESVEWLAYDADVIVAGAVTDSRKVKGPRDLPLLEVSFKVAESLKGVAREEITFLVRDMPAAGELLVFLVDSRRCEAYFGGKLPAPWCLRMSEWMSAPPPIGLDGAPKTGLFDADFREHRAKADILAAARRAVAAAGKDKAKTLRVEVPWDSDVQNRLYAGSAVYLVVPLDANLDRGAKGWLKDANLHPRVEAVRVMEHFRTAENIWVLQGLLKDSKIQTQGSRRHYPVRKEAFRVLTAWKVDVEKPVLEEP